LAAAFSAFVPLRFASDTVGLRAVRPRRSAVCACGNAATVSWREEDQPEAVVPDVSLTRSRDGSTGTATFRFRGPSVLSLHNVWDNGLITGMWLRDNEGLLKTTDLEVKFGQGRPMELVAILVLKSRDEWDRFMRFMERYAEANGLSFASASESEEGLRDGELSRES
jgi:photosystem II protein